MAAMKVLWQGEKKALWMWVISAGSGLRCGSTDWDWAVMARQTGVGGDGGEGGDGGGV